MEPDENKYSVSNLRSFSYRYLQQIAKSMHLPSNVKKMYLIELINTKKTKSSRELEELVQRVKLERKQLASKRRASKKRLQGAEVSSTWHSSPPVTRTSKRHSDVTKHSPDLAIQYKTEHKQLSNVLKVYSPPSLIKSDRVLRSFRDRPNYRIMNTNNTLIGVIKAQSPKATKINIISRGSNRPKFNVTAIVKKQSCEVNRDRQIIPYTRTKPRPAPRNQERRLSGISPLQTPERPIFTPTVNFTRKDGSMSRINALVHKPLQISYNRDKELYKMDDQTTQTITEYEPTYLTELIQHKVESTYGTESSQGVETECVVEDCQYYHKKIRAERVRSVRVPLEVASAGGDGGDCGGGGGDSLPAIAQVFRRLGAARRSLTQPIYVEVSTEAERALWFPPLPLPPAPMPPVPPVPAASPGAALERLYNLRAAALPPPPPLLQLAPAATTHCVFTTHTVTSVLQPPAVDDYNASYQRDSVYDGAGVVGNEYLSVAEQEALHRVFICDEVMGSSPSPCGAMSAVAVAVSMSVSADVSEESADASIPQMVEDAFELISQDGDYMERIGMEERMRCFLCVWAGPKFILEHHIRKEHSSQIESADEGACRLRFSLATLAAQGDAAQGSQAGEVGDAPGDWAGDRRIVSHDGRLLVLSAKYDDPQLFSAAIHSLSEDTETFSKLTIYNKVTGEPHEWHGRVECLSPAQAPFAASCLRLPLAAIDVLPNSARLRLINRALVLVGASPASAATPATPARVVVGEPALHDIYIDLFVQLWG